MLPVDVLRRIAGDSPAAYRAMLAVPPFARSLDPGTIADYMIAFGYTVMITRDRIVWKYCGEIHKLDGPAVIFVSGTRIWYKEGVLHRDGGPAIEHSEGYCVWYNEGNLMHNY